MEALYERLLDRRSREEWQILSRTVLRARSKSACRHSNEEIELALSREVESPLAPSYRLWVADNFAIDGDYSQSIKAYDRAIECALRVRDLRPELNPSAGALLSKAKALELSGDVASAVETLLGMERHPSDASSAFLLAGLLVEQAGNFQRAAELYSRYSTQKPSSHTDDTAEQCRRAHARLLDSSTPYAATPLELMDQLERALGGIGRDLVKLVSRTHFAVGPLGAHTIYEQLELVEELARDLEASTVAVKRDLLGGNAKMYIQTSGWNGRWFRGDVFFLLTRAPQGWQWTGLGLSTANERWLERWKPKKAGTNSPLPFGLLAPWPEGQHFMAGGLDVFIAQMAAIQSVGAFGSVVAGMYAAHPCGFGFRGYYYNMETTHVGHEAFGIDFSRYKKWVPFDNESGGTPVLAPRAGVVATVRNSQPSNDANGQGNFVHLSHADPNNPADDQRFTSRYLHLEGPFKIPVSQGMRVVTGNRLGLMDDTGNSLFDHLHFSIHDRQIPYKNWSIGASVRPSPMEGVKLEDDGSGTCIRSTNREAPVGAITQYPVKNWIITPCALAANEQAQDVRNQPFLLVLSGVVVVDMRGLYEAQWTTETVVIRPPLWDPLSYAIDKWGLPTPSANYTLEFDTEQWSAIVTLSSIWNKDVSVNSGYAVDAWRPGPWRQGQDAATNRQLDQLFDGLEVDLAVQDIDAWILRVGYHITLVGRIAYLPLGFTR